MADIVPRPPSLGEARALDAPGRDVWDLASLLPWLGFFCAGLAPEPVFYALRDWSHVAAQTAFVNTSAVITVAFSIYLGIFAYRRCRGNGLDEGESQSRAVTVLLLGFLAFSEIPAYGSQTEVRTLLELALRFREIPSGTYRLAVLFMGWSKLLAWWYLGSLVVRYHLFGRRDAFSRVPRLLGAVAETTPPVDAPPGGIEPPSRPEKWRDESRPDA